MIIPKDKKRGVYLCKVSGFEALNFMVLRYDGEYGWLEHTSTFMQFGLIPDGWCALDHNIHVTEVLQLLEEENYDEE